jgi:VWFA-related protein
VRLAQLDVVVRDKKGAIVSGLGPDEFTVLEDGSPMEIVAVDEWGAEKHLSAAAPSTGTASRQEPPADSSRSAAAAAPEEPERRSFVLVFDSLGASTALRMSQAKRAAATFVRTHLRPDDVAAVYQLDLSLRPLSGVTSNASELTRSIEKVTWMAASSLQDDIADSILSANSQGFAPVMKSRLTGLSVNAAQQLDWQREHVYETLNNLAAVFRGLPGRRVLVLASPGFPLTTAGDQKTGSGGFTPRFRELIRSLAEFGVTVYSLDIGDDLAAGDASETIDWRIAVGKLGMDENTLSDLGLERSMGSSSASARREFLGVIAAETGGRLMAQTDLAKAFNAIDEESTRFYRISCRVSVTAAADRYRRLLVKVKTPGYLVASRRGRYSDITPLARLATGAKTSVESLDRYRPLTARGVALPLPGMDPKKVQVDVVVEALGPIQIPADAKGRASLDVEFRLVARAEGEVVDRYERSFTAQVKPEGVEAIRRAFRVEGRLSLVPGIYEFQSSIRLGDPPQLASWTATVAVPPPKRATEPAFAGVVLTSESERASPLLSRPQVSDDRDPLTLKPGARILPATYDGFDAGGNLLVFFWIEGLPDAGEKPPELDLSVNIADARNQPATLPTTILYFGIEPTGGYRALARINASSLPPGAYSLKLTAGLTGQDGPRARHAESFTLHAKETPPSATSSSVPTP